MELVDMKGGSTASYIVAVTVATYTDVELMIKWLKYWAFGVILFVSLHFKNPESANSGALAVFKGAPRPKRQIPAINGVVRHRERRG
jgi:hypothetical protein